MNTIVKRSGIALAGLAAAALTGCGSGSNFDGRTDEPGASTGIFNLGISDGPIRDAAKVCIKFDGVELKPADDSDAITIDLDTPQVVNLLAHQGANSFPLISEEVPAGTYQWIRLKVDAARGNNAGLADSDPTDENCLADDGSYLIRDGGEHYSLFIPSGNQSGLKLIKDITIPVNASGDYTAEWDLGRSFIEPPGLAPDALMKPVVKVVSNAEVGTLVGRVDDVLVEAEACDAEFAPSVYVFPNGVTPNPIDFPPEGSEDPFEPPADDPVATGLVEQRMTSEETMEYRYGIGFLLATGADIPYVAAFTCDGVNFIPVDGKPAPIFIGEVTEVNFTADDQPESPTS